jgi:hypothetical protein
VVTGAIFPHVLAKSKSPDLGPFSKDATHKNGSWLDSGIPVQGPSPYLPEKEKKEEKKRF